MGPASKQRAEGLLEGTEDYEKVILMNGPKRVSGSGCMCPTEWDSDTPAETASLGNHVSSKKTNREKALYSRLSDESRAEGL